MKNRTRCGRLFRDAQCCLVGGVNSPVRAFKAVGGVPLFIDRAEGSRLFDADGNEYIDYLMSWGALILGHAYPGVVAAVKKQLVRGMSFGAPTEMETRLAERISKAVPSMQMVRLVNSGTEAAMSALRLARGYTRRSMIVKFEGCYHGHSDSLLVKAGSGAATLGVPDSAGVPLSVSKDTVVLPYNNIDAAERLFKRAGGKIAAVIVEPVAANMGVVMPEISFLKGLRELTRQSQSVLIFDEVITGFRFTYGGAQQLFGIEPDLTCLGKIIGGGMPLAAYGGDRRIMRHVSPLGPVYQAGTLSGNPLAVSAGLAVLEELERRDYVRLNQKAAVLCDSFQEIIRAAGKAVTVNRAGSLFTVFFTGEPVRDFAGARRSDTKAYARFFWKMLEAGVNMPPAQFEGNFLSFSHSDADINKTVAAFASALTGCPSCSRRG